MTKKARRRRAPKLHALEQIPVNTPAGPATLEAELVTDDGGPRLTVTLGDLDEVLAAAIARNRERVAKG